MDLRKKAVSGVSWAAANQFAVQGLRFVAGLVLARIIDPEEFGLLAMTTVFTATASAIAEGGFSAAIVQRKSLTDEDCSTAFWFNLMASLGMVVAGFFAAPLIAGFYGDDRLVGVIQAVSGTFVLAAFSACQGARLQRELKFRKIFLLRLPGLLAGIIIAIVLAVMGFGVWALVAQIYISTAVSAVMLWTKSGWRPGFVFRRLSLKEMFGYGSKLAGARAIDAFFQHIYVLVIGKIFSPLQVGYYHRAHSLQRLPSSNIYRLVDIVLFPLLSSMQEDQRRVKKAFELSLRGILLISCGLFVGSAVCAPQLVETILGRKWLPSAPYFQILCFVGMLWPVHALNLSILKALGKSGKVLVLELVKKGMVVTALLITMQHGIVAMIYGQLICSIVSLAINSFCSSGLVDVSLFRQLRVAAPYLLCSMLMGGGGLCLPPAGGLARAA